MNRKLLLPLIFGLIACGGGRARLHLLAPPEDPVTLSQCEQDERGNLILRIGNQGNRQSIATTTQVQFSGRPPFLMPTRPIPRGESVEVRVPVPEGCDTSPCGITVILDVRNEIEKQNTDSRQFKLRCQLRPFRLSPLSKN